MQMPHIFGARYLHHESPKLVRSVLQSAMTSNACRNVGIGDVTPTTRGTLEAEQILNIVAFMPSFPPSKSALGDQTAWRKELRNMLKSLVREVEQPCHL